MKNKFKGVLGAVAAVAALALGGAAIAGAAGGEGEGSEKPITGSALDKASQAALQHTGGGQVTDTEVGDEEGAYEVEVKRPDGSSVDVHLDSQFNHLSDKADDDRSGEDGK